MIYKNMKIFQVAEMKFSQISQIFSLAIQDKMSKLNKRTLLQL